MKQKQLYLDPILLITVLMLTGIGIVMVASSSISIAERLYGVSYYFWLRHLIYVMLGIALASITIVTPINFWRKFYFYALIVSIVLLCLVFIPGLGKEVNGGLRWLNLGIINVQVSEVIKVFIIIFIAGYMDKHQEKLSDFFVGFVKPVVILTLIAILLLLEPDFGALVVILLTVMGMLFIGGVKIRHFLIVSFCALSLLTIFAITSPYRWTRITIFLDPWSDKFDSGYQLIQALIAVGRGGWFGAGLGSSVQKLFYLPESHTDFLFAVLAEELGVFGVLLILSAFVVLITRALIPILNAQRVHQLFASYLGFGLILYIVLQFIISAGVNMGLLPTKGLTMPFMSYGGTSLVINFFAIGIILRINYEVMQNTIAGASRSMSEKK